MTPEKTETRSAETTTPVGKQSESLLSQALIMSGLLQKDGGRSKNKYPGVSEHGGEPVFTRSSGSVRATQL